MSPHEAALAYAARGGSVFPLRAGEKVPATRDGFKSASRDPAAIDAMFRGRPNANVGIATGEASGFWVLDVDGEPGADALHALEANHAELPPTYSVRTPNGHHFYFAWPEGGGIQNSASGLGEGLDVRAEGGYVVAPPSVVNGRRYVVDDDLPVADLPAWLHRLMTAKPSGQGTRPVGDEIPEGRRNATLAQLAGKLRRAGLGQAEIGAALTAINEQRCRPPLPVAEVARIAASVARYDQGSPPPKANGKRRRVVLTRASDIKPERLSWLWDQRLVLSGLSLIAGEPGLGKSTLLTRLAAELTRGRLGGELLGEPADVLMATAEDHWASVVAGRLVAAGADQDRIHQMHVEIGGDEELLTLPDDVAELERRCVELAEAGRPVAMVAVDPVAAFIGGSVDTHRDGSVRRVLAPLAKLAERQRLAVVAVAHLNKDASGKLLSRVGGSVAFGAAPRSVLAFARHPEDPDGEQGDRRVIVQAKSNHGRPAPTLAARIEARMVDVVGSASLLVIEGECEVGPEDLRPQTAQDHEERDEAADWLADELGDREWHPARGLIAAAADEGHKRRTLYRAKKTLNVEDQRGGFPAVSEWRLPVVPPPRGATDEQAGGTPGTNPHG